MTESPKDWGKPQRAEGTARSAIRHKETIALPVLLDAIALRGDSTATEAAEVLFEFMHGSAQHAGPPIYDADGDGLARIVPQSRRRDILDSLVNSNWWRRSRQEQGDLREAVDRWRLWTEDAHALFKVAVATLRGTEGAKETENLASALEELDALAEREFRRIIGEAGEDRTAPVSAPADPAVQSADHSPDYLNPTHDRYSPKLAAAVQAWLAVENPGGKHPKQALTEWLTKNAGRFNLTNKIGEPNKEGIEDCAKVANWKPSGGAPKTPGK